MYEAMKAMPGVTVPVDGAGGENGMFWFPRSMDPVTLERSYAKTGHWDDLNRNNYDLITGTKVDRVVFKGKKAVGVYMSPRVNSTQTEDGARQANGKRKQRMIKARKEVILAAGSIHTPQILQLSGIGPASLLKKAGIPVNVDLPGVGANFQDHQYLPTLNYRCKSLVTSTATLITS